MLRGGQLSCKHLRRQRQKGELQFRVGDPKIELGQGSWGGEGRENCGEAVRSKAFPLYGNNFL